MIRRYSQSRRNRLLYHILPSAMAANGNALTQPKFELGISGIIHNVFQTTKQKMLKTVGKKLIIFHLHAEDIISEPNDQCILF